MANFPTIKKFLEGESFVKRIESVLGKNSGAFVSSVLTMISEDGKLQQCKPEAIAREIIKCASFKLSLDKTLGHAYIVPYNNTLKDEYGKARKDERGNYMKEMQPQFLLGYKGIIQLALRSGMYYTINAGVVYEGELQGIDKLTGMLNLNGQRKSDKVVGYFAYMKMLNGFEKAEYWTLESMVKHAKRYVPTLASDRVTEDYLKELSMAPAQRGVIGWQGDFNGMAVKTCLRHLLKTYGDMTIDKDMSNAIAEDDRHMANDNTVEAEAVLVDIEEAQPAQLANTATASANDIVTEQAEPAEPSAKQGEKVNVPF